MLFVTCFFQNPKIYSVEFFFLIRFQIGNIPHFESQELGIDGEQLMSTGRNARKSLTFDAATSGLPGGESSHFRSTETSRSAWKIGNRALHEANLLVLKKGKIRRKKVASKYSSQRQKKQQYFFNSAKHKINKIILYFCLQKY